MSDNVAKVAAIYEAFGRGDVAFIVDQFADDVQWDHGIRETEVPYLQPFTGKSGVPGFFTALLSNLEFTRFEPGPLCEGQDTVMVTIMQAGRSATGKMLADHPIAHLWKFGADGLALSFNHIGDLALYEALL